MTSFDIGEMIDREVAAALADSDRKERCLHEHGYGCSRSECGRSEHGVVSGMRPWPKVGDRIRCIDCDEMITYQGPGMGCASHRAVP